MCDNFIAKLDPVSVRCCALECLHLVIYVKKIVLDMACCVVLHSVSGLSLQAQIIIYCGDSEYL